MSKNILLNFFLIFLLIGVFVNNLLIDLTVSLLVLLFLVILFFNFSIYTKKYNYILIFSIFGLLAGIFISFFNLELINNKITYLKPYLDNQKYELTLEIKGIDKINNDYIVYKTKLLSIEGKQKEYNIDSMIFVPLNYKLKSGEVIKSSFKLYSFKNLGNFKYKEYMISRNIYFKGYVNNFDKITYNKPNDILLNISKLRGELLSIIYKLYPKEEAIFLGGILLGARESLPKELKVNFNNSGLTHFIAVSGFNITILVVFFSLFLKYFPIWFRIIGITVFIVLFVLLVGFTVPVIRAAIMGLIAYYILLSGRKGSLLSIILITAFILIIYSPFSLNYDISLHLSFLAVLGIVYTQKFFTRMFYFLPQTLAIREAFVLTLSALSFSLPIMIFDFGQVSILSVFANLAVTWTIPIAMLLGFLSIIVYYVYVPLGWGISYLAWIFLKWDMLMVEFFGTQKWSLLKFELGDYGNYLKLIYFVILIFIVVYFKDNKKGQ